MKTIKLTKGYVTLVDDEDYDELNQCLWHYSSGYAKRAVGRKLLPLQNQLLKLELGLEIDHIDGNRLNNTKANLRIVTHAQNSQNASIRRNNTSGYVGVSWNKANQNWNVKIRVEGQNRHIGCFTNVEDAARAYDKKALEVFGPDAKQNFPPITLWIPPPSKSQESSPNDGSSPTSTQS